MRHKPRALRTTSGRSLAMSRTARKTDRTSKSSQPASSKAKATSPAAARKRQTPPDWLLPEEKAPNSAPNADWSEWLASRGEQNAAESAFQAVAWADSLGNASESEEKSERFSLLRQIADEAAGASLETSPLVHQLLRGELRLKLGVLSNEAALARDGFHSLIEGLDQLLDPDGSPYLNAIHDFPALVACWLRSLRLVKRKKLFEADIAQKAEILQCCKALALRLAQLSRFDGSRLFSAGKERIPASLILDALQFWSNKEDRRNAGCLRRDLFRPVPKAATEKIARAVCSDVAGLAIYRSEPKPDAAYAAAAFDDRAFWLEMGAKGVPFLSGEAVLELTRDGHSIAPTGQWEEVCRHQEPEIEYWELERTFERGVWLQRQIILICKDRQAYFCDNLVADGPAQMTYALRVPLAVDAQAEPANETREMILRSGKMAAPLLPLAAEEWRVAPSHFDLLQDDGRIKLTGATQGQRMAIAWLLDLRGERKVEELTWRQLRVAENLQNLPRDIAVAFRWQFGNSQWMAYRSLAAPSNRTVLGQNIVVDFLLSRVLPNGKTKDLVEIE